VGYFPYHKTPFSSSALRIRWRLKDFSQAALVTDATPSSGARLRLGRAGGVDTPMMMSARPKRRLVVLAVLGHRWAAVMEAGAAIGSGGLYLLLQLLVGQPRPSPDQVAGPIQLSGFPSGHLATFVAVFGFLAYLGYRRLQPSGPRWLPVGLVGG
jgi:membrane-associated phospholipid phosphatase